MRLIFALLTSLFFGSSLFGIPKNELEAILKDRFSPTTQTPYSFTPKVDVITGYYNEDETDLVIAGIEPISFRRFYLNSSPYDARFGNWNINPESFAVANFELVGSDQFVSCGSREGNIHSFEGKSLTNSPSQVVGTYAFDVSKNKNCLSSGGNTHPFNTKINFRRKQGIMFAYEGEIKDGNGGIRFFKTPLFNWMASKKNRN